MSIYYTYVVEKCILMLMCAYLCVYMCQEMQPEKRQERLLERRLRSRRLALWMASDYGPPNLLRSIPEDVSRYIISMYL